MTQLVGDKIYCAGRLTVFAYLTPKDGRPTPPDTRANDLRHWQTTLSTQNAAIAAKTITAAQARFISPGVVEIPEKQLGFAKGFLVRDPDGHALQLVEK
jgi:hypothetical protein